jgi:hemerythrin superfamily protein
VNAIKLLETYHQHVKDLFRKYEDLPENGFDKKAELSKEIFQELMVHTTIEEEIFYPEIKEKVQKLDELVTEGFEEHHVVEMLMEELKGMKPQDEAFDPKLKVLMENVRHHIGEEEKQMFPGLKPMRDELDELGDRMAQRKSELKSAAAR